MFPAGRSGDGQPASSGSPGLDLGSSGDLTSATTEDPAAGATVPDGTAASASGSTATSRAVAGSHATGSAATGSAATGSTVPGSTVPGSTAPGSAPPQTPGPRSRSAIRRAFAHAWVRNVTLLLIYEVAGIAATWPRSTYLPDGKLPASSDVSSFVWDIWWVAHQLVHPGNPYFTRYMAAPVGTHLGFSTIMPLAGWLISPVTVLYGPSAAFSLLTIITPGLLCYAMYRAARLWLNEPGAIIAGAFFGLSSMLLWQNWYHLNVAMGTIFLPLTLEAAVRFRRKPRLAAALWLGVAVGASILVNQESTVVAVFIAAAILIPWLIGQAIGDRAALRRAITPLLIGGAVAIVVASPQLIAMAQQALSGGAKPPIGQLSNNYTQFGVPLPTLFAPSPRLADSGLGQLASAYSFNEPLEGVPTFGVLLSGLAVLGIAAGWRKRSTWGFVVLWLGFAVVSLGTSLTFGTCLPDKLRPGLDLPSPSCHQFLPLMGQMNSVRVNPNPLPPFWAPVHVSNLMPYTWLVRIPGLAGLREADRFALVGLIGAAMLTGLAVQWLSKRKITMPLIAVILGLGALELGWAGTGGPPTMPTTLPVLDHPLTHDHTKSIVVDVPYGLRGGVAVVGAEIAPNAMLIATHDEHPRAISYTAWVSQATIAAVSRHAFYRYLMVAENGTDPTPANLRAASADLRRLNVGWVIEWRNIWTGHHPFQRYGHVDKYLKDLGFRHRRGACLVGSPSRPLRDCPRNQQVWLYRYRPGTASKAG